MLYRGAMGAMALAAFTRDLGERMRNVVVLTMSEFGRTVRENGTSGTDHGHATAMLVLGGPVNGGRVLGKWPGLEDRDVAVGVPRLDGERVRRLRGQSGDRRRGTGDRRGERDALVHVVPGDAFGRATSGAKDATSCEARFEAEDVLARDAVLERARAAGVLRDVAADRACLLAGRVGRVVKAVLRDRLR